MRYLVSLILAGQLVAETAVLREGSLLKFTIREPIGMGAHAPVNAELAIPVFDGGREILPTGSKLQLTPAQVWKQRAPGRKRSVATGFFVPSISRLAPLVWRFSRFRLRFSGWAGAKASAPSGRGHRWWMGNCYTSLAVGATLFGLQRGRDASLPEYTEIEITLSRPVRLEATVVR